MSIPGATLIALPGGHHFDQDYPKLAKRIIEKYRQLDLKQSS
jgi:type IV secretory pathway VirJ component